MKRGDDVDPERLAARRRPAGELLGGVAEPAADVQHALAGPGRVQRSACVAVCASPADDDLAELHEAVEQRPVPRLDRLGVVHRYVDGSTVSTSTAPRRGSYPSSSDSWARKIAG